MVYAIVQWLQEPGRLKEEDFESEEKLKRAIERLDDGTGKVKGWLESSGDDFKTQVYEPGKGQTARIKTPLQTKLDGWQENYIEETKTKIESITDPDELERFKINSSVPSTITQIQEAIDKRMDEISIKEVTIDGQQFEIPKSYKPGRGGFRTEEVEQIVEQISAQTLDEIQSASTKEELDGVKIPSDLPREIRSYLSQQLKDAYKEVQ